MSFLFRIDSSLPTIHAILISFFGIYFAMTDKSTSRSIILIFYITGSELLWRGMYANIFWEYGKVSTLAITLILLLRMGFKRLSNKFGLLIITLLLPSIIILEKINRQDISHALLGPIVLGFCVLAFSNQVFNRKELIMMLQALIFPIVGLLSLMIFSTITKGDITYHAAYIYKSTTAGMGPNQASNILGLGFFICFVLFVLDKNYRLIYLVFGILLFLQTIFTFSRGGLYNGILSIGVSYFFLITGKQKKIKFSLGFIALTTCLYIAILPRIDSISGGAIIKRLSDQSVESRKIILRSELIAFRENLILGIGPGMSRAYRLYNFNDPKHTHTEYTRLLAEHGTFGLFVIVLLIRITFKNFKSNEGISKSIVISFAIWSFLFMLHSATRLVAPSVIFALSASHLKLNKKDK